MPAPLLVSEVIASAGRATPERLAVALGDETCTFGDLLARGASVAAGLQGQGIEAGDLVLVLGTVSVDLPVVFAGAALAGAVFAPADPRLPDETLASMARRTDARLVVGCGEWAGRATEVGALAGLAAVTAEDLDAGGSPASVDLAETDPHVVFFTSGTSGEPKGVVLSHKVSVLRSHPGSQLEDTGRLVCPYPLFHMAGWTMGLKQWHARAGLVLLERAEAVDIVDAVRRHDATRLNAIPGVWRRILDHIDDTGGPPLTSLRLADTGTYATPPELLAAIDAVAPNAQVRVFYGSTEMGNVVALDHADILERVGSCGKPSPMVEVRLADDGELQVRTPVAFDGYLNDPDATAAAHDDGWFRTGDVATIDDDGFLSIVGRLGQLIRTGGESVSPSQVEAVFVDVPELDDVAVVGLPHERWGEIVTLCVVVDGAAPDLGALVDAHADHLAPHQRPRRLEVVDSIPRTAATGQVDRAALVASLDG
ncbi:MAG: class I adenylate-forming enzyme family protein [Actinomycetota bacterium]